MEPLVPSLTCLRAGVVPSFMNVKRVWGSNGRRVQGLVSLALGGVGMWGCSGSDEVSGESAPSAVAPTGTTPDRVPSNEGPRPIEEADIPAVFGPAALRQLSVTEYTNTIRALLSSDEPLATQLERDVPLNGLTAIGKVESAMTSRATERFESAAYEVAERWAQATTPGCDLGAVGCYEELLTRMGRLAWRRPLTEAEVARYAGVARGAAMALTDAREGLVFGLAGLLQSPHFLYRVELGEPDVEFIGRRKLNAHELASRLSYFITAAPPDAALSAAADADTLSAEVRSHAERLLATVLAERAAGDFLSEYMSLDRLLSTEKSSELFPEFDASLKQAMLRQTELTLTELAFKEGLDFRQLFTTKRTFLNRELAVLYGVGDPVVTGSEAFVPYEFAASEPRAGILTHASFLASNAHLTITSPTYRGKFVREHLLCQGIPAPPPNVVTDLQALGPDIKTTRQRFEQHALNAACASCHQLMDPIGLGFENFDPVGAYRDTENGVTIDASGDLDGVAYNGAVELGQRVAEHESLPSCLVSTVFRHASGGLVTSLETSLLDALNQDFTAATFKFPALLLASVSHPAFGYVREFPAVSNPEMP